MFASSLRRSQRNEPPGGVPIIRTKRLTLEPASEEHVEGLVAAIRSSLPQLQPWMAWTVDWEPEESRRYLSDRPKGDHLSAVIVEGRVIGIVSILVAKPSLGWGELGYWVATEHAGKGYMTEALDAFISWAFEDLGLHRVELRAGVDNAASNRVAEKLGFTNCGVVRETAVGAGGFYDCNLWELVVGDPRPPLRQA